MNKRYKHINEQDRLRIYELILEGVSIIEIADTLGFHKATIYRELYRNSSKFGYRPDFASQQYKARKRVKPQGKIEGNKALEEEIISKLKEGWSPEQISGRLARDKQRKVISHEAIYLYIYSPNQRTKKLYQYLRKKRKFRYPRVRRRRRNNSQGKVSIHDRPHEVNTRRQFGHWEGDLILFSKTKENIFTLRERKTRFLIGIKNSTRHAKVVSKSLVCYMQDKMALIDSLTLDNDTSFRDHQAIGHTLGSNIYFCDPYKSWQKGAIENGNRLIREKLPFKTEIKLLSQTDIENELTILNSRPMKCLSYLSPKEAFLKESYLRGII